MLKRNKGWQLGKKRAHGSHARRQFTQTHWNTSPTRTDTSPHPNLLSRLRQHPPPTVGCSMRSHTQLLAPFLPVEILQIILEFCPRDALPLALRASSVAYLLGCQILHRQIDSRSTRKSILLLKTLTASNEDRPSQLPHPAIFVKIFRLSFCSNHVSSNLLRLIRRALSSLSNTWNLKLDSSSFDYLASPGWVLADITTPISVFSTTLRCDDMAVARFLESQPSLCLVDFR